MCAKCEMCGNIGTPGARSTVQYDEEYDGYLCGICWQKFNDGVEEAEEHRRERIAIENEY